MNRPKIGITTSYQDGEQRLNANYAHAIELAGGLPIILPLFRTDEFADDYANWLDGLLIPGGPGITRGLVGNLPADLAPVDPLRDQSDQLIVNAFAQRPIMGICYGMQFLNAIAGGEIYGDLSEHINTNLIHTDKRGGTSHPIELDTKSYFAQVLGRQSLEVNTYHIQSIATLGEGLSVVAHSPDGVIEAIESPDQRLFGVQFHPERDIETMLPLFQDFVARCGNNAYL